MPPQDNNSNPNNPTSPANPGVNSSNQDVRVGDIITPTTQPEPQDSLATPASGDGVPNVGQMPVEAPSQPDSGLPTAQPSQEPATTNFEPQPAPASEVQAASTMSTPPTPATQEYGSGQPASQSPLPSTPPDTSALFQPDSSAATSASTSNTIPKPKKSSHLKAILLILVLVVIYAGSAAAAFYLGTKSQKTDPAQLAVKANSIQLPKEAIVTAECAPGRGKQYIIPKDIPIGPIYDVKDGQVIAIEYLLSVSSLLTQADAFTDKITELTKLYTVDHFKLVPTPVTSSQADQQLHLIMFIVPKSVSESITCEGVPATTESNASQMTNTTQQ